MSPKPSFLWHADEDGLCRETCEAWDEHELLPSCRIVLLLPFLAQKLAIAPGRPCPFAVLAEALCVHRMNAADVRRKVEQTDEPTVVPIYSAPVSEADAERIRKGTER